MLMAFLLVGYARVKGLWNEFNQVKAEKRVIPDKIADRCNFMFQFKKNIFKYRIYEFLKMNMKQKK